MTSVSAQNLLSTGKQEKRVPDPVQAAAVVSESEELPVKPAEPDMLPITAEGVQQTLNLKEEESLPVPPTGKTEKAENRAVTPAAEADKKTELPIGTEPSNNATQMAMQLLHGNSSVQAEEKPLEETEAEELPVKAKVFSKAEVSPKYTADMPVEEIRKQMTFEEAQKVVVDVGICNGWTIGEVAEKRPASLKFYVYGGYKGNNNVLRAAAQITLDSLAEKKAG